MTNIYSSTDFSNNSIKELQSPVRRKRNTVGFHLELLTDSVRAYISRKYSRDEYTERSIRSFASGFAHTLNNVFTTSHGPESGVYCYSDQMRTSNNCTLTNSIFGFRAFKKTGKFLAFNYSSNANPSHPCSYELTDAGSDILDMYNQRLCSTRVFHKQKNDNRINIAFDLLTTNEFIKRSKSYTFMTITLKRMKTFIDAANNTSYNLNVHKNRRFIERRERLVSGKQKTEATMKNIVNSKNAAVKSFNIIDYSKLSTLLTSVKYFDGKNYHVQLDEIRVEDDMRYCNQGTYFCSRSYNAITNMPKRLRKILFKDYYECDIDTSVFSMMLNIRYHDYRTNTIKSNYMDLLKVDSPRLHEMIVDKDHFRGKYAKECNLTVTNFKKMLIALSYDVQFDYAYFISHNYNKKSSQTYNKPVIDEMANEIKELSNYFNEYLSDEGNKNVRIADLRIGDVQRDTEEEFENMKTRKPQNFGRGKRHKAKRNYIRYSIFESAVRNQMMNIFDTTVQIHDCVIFELTEKTRSVIQNVSAIVQSLCGLLVPFTFEKIIPIKIPII